MQPAHLHTKVSLSAIRYLLSQAAGQQRYPPGDSNRAGQKRENADRGKCTMIRTMEGRHVLLASDKWMMSEKVTDATIRNLALPPRLTVAQGDMDTMVFSTMFLLRSLINKTT